MSMMPALLSEGSLCDGQYGVTSGGMGRPPTYIMQLERHLTSILSIWKGMFQIYPLEMMHVRQRETAPYIGSVGMRRFFLTSLTLREPLALR